MRRVFIALAVGVLSGQALAADLPERALPAAPVYVPIAPPIFSWSGKIL